MRVLQAILAILCGFALIVVTIMLFTIDANANHWAVVLIGGKGLYELSLWLRKNYAKIIK